MSENVSHFLFLASFCQKKQEIMIASKSTIFDHILRVKVSGMKLDSSNNLQRAKLNLVTWKLFVNYTFWLLLFAHRLQVHWFFSFTSSLPPSLISWLENILNPVSCLSWLLRLLSQPRLDDFSPVDAIEPASNWSSIDSNGTTN